MKCFGIVLAAVAALVIGGQPLAAHAAEEAKAPAITAKQREQGKAEAPAALAAAKTTCTPTDAYFVQAGVDAKTKAKTSLYEVSCAEGLGYLVQTGPTGSMAYDCLAVAANTAKGAVQCRLEGNLDPKQAVAKLAVAAGQTCASPTAARWMGATPTGDAYYEVACTGGQGYVIQTSPGKTPVASECLAVLGSPTTACTLTSKETVLAGMGALAAKSGTPCTVSNARVVGSAQGSTYYEVACGATPGFMIQADAKHEFQQAIPCAKAQSIGGGCQLTIIDETAEAGTYTKLAQNANFPCEVSKYRYLGKETKSNSELVELACKNRADGGIGVFPISGGKAQVLDCLQGGAYGVTCQLTPPAELYAKYTARLVAQGKTQCKVSAGKYLASTTEGADYIETACSDGLPGFVVAVDHATGATKDLLTCGQVARSGAPCTLPTNQTK
ncbi:MAG TPA: hypothetical protein VL358_01630 [Caulobacteraceae bacterium]|jgi:hypothetical protein|nr:hypothetical protein [Caulobacteraceae bacterium]